MASANLPRSASLGKRLEKSFSACCSMDLPMISSPTRLRTLSMRPASTRRIFSTVFCGIRGSRVAGWALAGADALLSDSDIDDSDVDESSIDDSDVDDLDSDDS